MDLLEIQILTNNIQETQDFYENIPGLPLLSKSSHAVSFAAGASTLTFIHTESPDPFYHFAFNIPDNKIDEAFSMMGSKIEILPVHPTGKIADFTSWNAKAFYFYDNNGNILEFIARFGLHRPSDRPFGGSAVLSLSEIGLVADNPAMESERIRAEHNFSYFEKQAPKDDFIVIGDDNGLLIFVENLRNWYPTNKAAQKNTTRVRVADKGRITEISIQP
jgi:catechol 2,3-dioxygenase-like lactoylglutathione lyase family enzyme